MKKEEIEEMNISPATTVQLDKEENVEMFIIYRKKEE